jgi:DNA-binding NtrC family response regulator
VQALLRHPWPGNIRELENVMHLALLMSNMPHLRPEDLNLIPVQPDDMDRPAGRADGLAHSPSDVLVAPSDAIAAHLRRWFSAPGDTLYGELERLIVTEAYQHCGRNQVQSAELLGVSRNVLRNLLRRHGHLATRARKDTSGYSAAPEGGAPARAWMTDEARA